MVRPPRSGTTGSPDAPISTRCVLPSGRGPARRRTGLADPVENASMPSTFGTAVEQGGSGGWDVLTAIATAAGVLATVAAVVVALYLAKQGDRTRVREANARATAQARLVRLAEPNWVIG